MNHPAPGFRRGMNHPAPGFRRGMNHPDARTFRREVGLPVIADGGFQQRSFIEGFAAGVEVPDRPCTFCNRCAVRTTILPLGCYEPRRFASREEMERQIVEWCSQD